MKDPWQTSCMIMIMAGCIVLAFLVAGCTAPQGPGTPPPETTPGAPSAMPTAPGGTAMPTAAFTDEQNGQTVTIPAGNLFTVSLKENPTTGFQWNVTLSSGLSMVSDDYKAPPPGLVGAGGTHVWTVKAVTKGNQTFRAIYQRSWEPVTGNETAYQLFVSVV